MNIFVRVLSIALRLWHVFSASLLFILTFLFLFAGGFFTFGSRRPPSRFRAFFARKAHLLRVAGLGIASPCGSAFSPKSNCVWIFHLNLVNSRLDIILDCLERIAVAGSPILRFVTGEAGIAITRD